MKIYLHSKCHKLEQGKYDPGKPRRSEKNKNLKSESGNPVKLVSVQECPGN